MKPRMPVARLYEGSPLPDTKTLVAVVFENTPMHAALNEWLRFHGFNPARIPCSGYNPAGIYRDAAKCRIMLAYCACPEGKHLYENHQDGTTRITWKTEQGEAPPLPYPTED
jgi:hypothetical protein